MSTVVISGDTSGSITLQAPAVSGTTTLTLPATSGTVLQSGTAVTEAQGGTGTTTGYYGFKNRIINGAMMIDQRNAGASVTPNNTYTIDRWLYENAQTGKVSIQQNAGAVTPPAGFVNYLGVTSLSAYSSLSTDYFAIEQLVEGLNVADLGWGTANAQTVTISFWLRSSLTGTHSAAFVNSASNRSYSFTFTVSAANTWEYKTVTVAGDTSGTWLTTNGVGIRLRFNLGSGSSAVTTAGSWQAANSNGATGSVSIVGTNGATLYITGVQLEKGSTATSFDYRPFGTELALCQRYFQQCGNGFAGSFDGSTTVTVALNEKFTQTMRAAPTIAAISGRNCGFRSTGGDFLNGAPGLANAVSTTEGLWTQVTGFTGGTANAVIYARNGGSSNLFISASAEL